jgi:hypothetical protein
VEFDEESRCYSLPADYPHILIRELERDGTYAVEARDRKRFREEREDFHNRVLADRERENVGATATREDSLHHSYRSQAEER